MKLNILILLLVSTLSYGDKIEEIFPINCTPLVANTESIHLTTQQPTLILIHNLSQNELWITNAHAFNPNLNAHFKPGRWAALFFKENTHLNCIESKPGHEQQVACGQIVALCSWKELKNSEKYHDSFWPSKNKPLGYLIAYLQRQGFIS